MADEIELAADEVVPGKPFTDPEHTEREQEALKRGGVQRLWLGNLKAGEHEVTAFFTGQGPHERDYKRGTTLQVEKGVGAKYVELRISDKASKLQPDTAQSGSCSASGVAAQGASAAAWADTAPVPPRTSSDDTPSQAADARTELGTQSLRVTKRGAPR